jgi:hypothetical protein
MSNCDSKFSSIPVEQVATDVAARAAVDAALKVPENRPLCEEMLRRANEREATDEKQYATHAWRRAAIVLAEAPINLFCEEGEKMLRWGGHLDMPVFGKTTKHAYQFVVRERMRSNLAANPMIAFPPAWRDGMKDDVRFLTALRVARAIVECKYNRYNLGNRLDMYAHIYYFGHGRYVTKMMIDIMEHMAGVDNESKFAHIPGLLVAQ